MKLEKQFSEIIQLIKQAQSKAIKAANTELIALYWQIGEYISKRIESEEWPFKQPGQFDGLGVSRCRPARRNSVQHAQVQLVIRHHIQVRAQLHQTAGRAQVRLPARVLVRVDVQIAQVF